MFPQISRGRLFASIRGASMRLPPGGGHPEKKRPALSEGRAKVEERRTAPGRKVGAC